MHAVNTDTRDYGGDHSRKPVNSSHETRTVSSLAILDVAFASDILTHLAA